MIEPGTYVSQSGEDSMHTPEEFAIVERVARIVSSVYGARPDYTRLAAELEPAISFDVFGIVLLHHDRQAVRITTCHRDDTSLCVNGAKRWTALYHQHPLEGSMLERMLSSTALVVREYPNGLDGPPAECGDALSNYHQLRSTCVVPLHTEERVLGMLELGSIRLGTYTNPTMQRLIGAVAQVLATAIERAQLGGSAEMQNRQRQALKDVSSALASEMDLSTILNHIVVGITNALNVASVIVTFNHREETLRLEAQSGLDPLALNKLIHSELALTEQSIIGSTLRHRQPYISNDIEVDEHFPLSRCLTSELGIRSILSYPLVTSTTVYGALLLCSPEPGGFTPLKADILALFASQATIAIHNGMLLESARQRRRFQNAIERLEQVLRPLPDKQREEEEHALLAHVREETQRTFGVSLTSLLRFMSDNLLTQNERSLQPLLHKYEREYTSGEAIGGISNHVPLSLEEASSIASGKNGSSIVSEEDGPFVDSLLMLTQTAEAALARAGVLSELSRLLMQLKQPAHGVKDAWFVVDLAGTCIYMNPSAESFCNMRMMYIENAHVTLEHIFAELLPRIRNAQEVHQYVQNFTHDTMYTQELRCVLVLDPIYPRYTLEKTKEESHFPGIKREGVNSDRNRQGKAATSSEGNILLGDTSSDSHYQLTRYPLHNQQGQLTAYTLQVRDVTMQVQDEKNKSALLSSVSHDLRTPLTTIKAAVTGLLETEVPWDEQMRREMLEDIDSETDHLTVLINALVEMSRIEMGALILEKEWCDIVEIVDGALAKAKRVLADRPVRVHFQTPLPLVYVDHVQLGRVFYNLIENAARHSPEDVEIAVVIDTTNAISKAMMLRVQVIDRGNSIPEYERERIFKAFYGLRSHSSGLGLTICKGIIEAHQGNIWVEAAEDAGSRFVFTLPTHLSSMTYTESDHTFSEEGMKRSIPMGETDRAKREK